MSLSLATANPLAAPMLPPRRPQPVAWAAILALHVVGGWLLLQVPSVRDAVMDAAPLTVTLVAAERAATAPAPAPELPPPRTPPSAPQAPLLAVPVVDMPLPVAPPRPAAPTAPPDAPPAPPSAEPAIVAVPAPPPNPPAERQIAITQVEYLAPPVLAYPLAARRQREKGLVQVRVRVDEQGRPERYVVARSSGHVSLDEAALQTVRATRFKPYTENGVPMPFWVVMPLLFELDS